MGLAYLKKRQEGFVGARPCVHPRKKRNRSRVSYKTAISSDARQDLVKN